MARKPEWVQCPKCQHVIVLSESKPKTKRVVGLRGRIGPVATAREAASLADARRKAGL